MKMAKASKADIDMAVDLAAAFDSLTRRWGPAFPQGCGDTNPDADDDFDRDDDEHCGRALRYLLDLIDRGSIFRVVMGMAVVLDPRNRCVAPNADTIEHHPDAEAGLEAKHARPLDDWSEAAGAVLWWRFPVDEPPYCGHPNCDDWPGYHTHWTPLVVPNAPAVALATEAAEPPHEVGQTA